MKNSKLLTLVTLCGFAGSTFAAPFAVRANENGDSVHAIADAGSASQTEAADDTQAYAKAGEIVKWADEKGNLYNLNTKTKEATLTHVALFENSQKELSGTYTLKKEIQAEGVSYTITTIGSYDEKGNGISIYGPEAASLPENPSVNAFYFYQSGMSIESGGYYVPENMTVCQNAFGNFNGTIFFPNQKINLKWGVKQDGDFGSAVSETFQGAIVGDTWVKEAVGTDAGYYKALLNLSSYPQEAIAGEKIKITVNKNSWIKGVAVNAAYRSEKEEMQFPILHKPAQYGVVPVVYPAPAGPVEIEMEQAGTDDQGNIVLSSKDVLPEGFGSLFILMQAGNADALQLILPVVDPKAPESKWVDLPDGKHAYSWHGETLKDCWWFINKDWFHFDKDGIMSENEWVSYQGEHNTEEKTYVDHAGHAIVNRWAKINGSWYYFNENAFMQRSRNIEDKGKWYHLKSNGQMAASQWIQEGSKWLYYDSAGERKTGWLQSNGTWYYLNKEDGAMHTGWLQDNGKWYYLEQNGAMAANRWIGNWYADANGVCTKK